MTTQKTADRIISTLVAHHPVSLTDNEIAAALGLPAPSVRRTRSRLETDGMILYIGQRRVGRTTASTFTAAEYLVAARLETSQASL